MKMALPELDEASTQSLRMAILQTPYDNRMKITKVEALYLRQPEVKDQCDSGQDAVIVRVETDAGITGLGEVDSAPLAVKGAIEGPYSHSITSGLGELLIGEDPFETEYLWHKMYKANSYCGRRGILIHAISGIDLALWDIKGKALGLPVWKLLGGGFHKKIRCYASNLFGATPGRTEEIGRRLVDEGFGALDQERLDDVMTELLKLRADGRTVGVISHVSEMKKSIMERITVIPLGADKGSTLEVSWM